MKLGSTSTWTAREMKAQRLTIKGATSRMR